MSEVILFVGPTLTAAQIRQELAAELWPPAARGDLLQAALREPRAIGLVDGYFDRVPAVWHKEILWAMSRGIHVFGAASMGALRAAELADFGMEGVGEIFAQYRDGRLEDDDEVAIIHAAAERGYRPLSEAMVNLRATLRAAERAGVVSAATGKALTTLAKSLAYPERSYPALLSAAAAHALPAAELARLERWLPEGAVNQKRDDARALLELMAERGRAGWQRKEVGFRFSPTDAWHALYDDVSRRSVPEGTARAATASELYAELLLDGDAARARDGALARALCRERLERLGVELEPAAVAAAVEDFRREHGLLTAEAFADWLARARLDGVELEAFFQREAAVRVARLGLEGRWRDELADYLRATGEYGALVARAEAKARTLAEPARTTGLPRQTRLAQDELWQWYFSRRGEPVPADLSAHARALGGDLEQLRTAVAAERRFVSEGGEGGEPRPNREEGAWQRC